MAIFFVAFNAALAPQEALQALRDVLNAKKSHRITTGAWLLEVPDPKRAIDLRIELLHYVPKESDVNLSVIRVDHSANDGTAIALSPDAQLWLAKRRSTMPSGLASDFS